MISCAFVIDLNIQTWRLFNVAGNTPLGVTHAFLLPNLAALQWRVCRLTLSCAVMSVPLSACTMQCSGVMTSNVTHPVPPLALVSYHRCNQNRRLADDQLQVQGHTPPECIHPPSDNSSSSSIGCSSNGAAALLIGAMVAAATSAGATVASVIFWWWSACSQHSTVGVQLVGSCALAQTHTYTHPGGVICTPV